MRLRRRKKLRPDFHLPLDGGGREGLTPGVELYVAHHPTLSLPIKGRG
jgi:hypothetical protein